MDDRLDVPLSPKLVARALQSPPQLAEVVNFAVEHAPDRAVFVRQRLSASFQVDDRQPPMPKRYARLGVIAGLNAEIAPITAAVVRPSMSDQCGHPLER